MTFTINGTSGATFPDSTTQNTVVPAPGTMGKRARLAQTLKGLKK